MRQFTKQRAFGLMDALEQMQSGEELVVFRFEYTRNTVDNYASRAGRATGRRYSVHAVPEEEKYVIRREA